MAERKEFFEVTVNFEELEVHARSKDSTLRWVSAIELGQIGTEEAASLLWSLTTDADENVRDAAKLGLNQCDPVIVGKVLSTKWTVEPSDESDVSVGSMAMHVAWKIRPLDIPTPENEWMVDAAVLNIIQMEGPITGARLMRLYGSAVYPDSPKRLSKSRITSAAKRLQRRFLVARADDLSGVELDFWTLYNIGGSEIVIREQGQRRLGEIPASEVRACVKQEMGERFERASRDDRFAVLLSIYGIKPRDFHIVGAILENEWQGLLKS